MNASNDFEYAGRVLDAALHLLDRQMIDRDGMMAGKVDDLELTLPEEGGPPFVTAIHSGPGGLARRVGGRLGAWIESVHARLHPSESPGPARVPFGIVTDLGADVRLSVAVSDLEVDRFQRWTRDHIIARIPGAGTEESS